MIDRDTYQRISSANYQRGLKDARFQDREKVAQMMMRLSIATGHGDTIDDLLAELEAAIRARH